MCVYRSVRQLRPGIPNTSSSVKDVNMIIRVDCDTADLPKLQVVVQLYLWPIIDSLDT